MARCKKVRVRVLSFDGRVHDVRKFTYTGHLVLEEFIKRLRNRLVIPSDENPHAVVLHHTDGQSRSLNRVAFLTAQNQLMDDYHGLDWVAEQEVPGGR